jgi:DNA-binding beta-propeller fold protein YncE
MNTVIPISTATNAAGKPIHLPQGGYGPDWIAITPDGKTAYVLGRSTSGHTKGKVTPVNTATTTPGKPIYLPWLRGKGSTGIAIAITPGGKTAYVSTDYPRTVVPIRTATNTAGKPITINGPDPLDGGGIAITPDEKTAYDACEGAVIPIRTATSRAGQPIRLGSSCRSELLAVPEYGIVITPDGKTAYVACEGAVVPIRTATNTVGRPIHVPLGYAMGIAITP